ncbi:hypothetical protein HNR44_002779 [Geomicrobium halophilum]|uniref:Cytosolic protein n=1 Tax=Geomicrobium halophilum TaxID=549000 RepID=A0A841PPX2_9BACL|nr:hypothetical protein [Geomicrobium halophilum]
MRDKDEEYTDFANVEDQRRFLTAEEYPEGTYGSPGGETDPVENKDTPWEPGQQFISHFAYEDRNLHQDRPRKSPGAHLPHDEKYEDREDPFKDAPNTSRRS